MPGIGLLRRLRIRLSPVDRAAVTMNRGRGAGSILPFLLDPSDPTSAGLDNQDNCFRWNQIIHIPSGTNEGEPARATGEPIGIGK